MLKMDKTLPVFLVTQRPKEADKTVHYQMAAGGEGCEALTSHRGTGLQKLLKITLQLRAKAKKISMSFDPVIHTWDVSYDSEENKSKQKL